MKSIRKDKKGFYYFPLANNSSSLIAAFSNRHTSVDYKEFLENLSIDYRKLVCLKQAHKADIIEVCSGIGKYKISPYTAGDGSEGVQAPRFLRGDSERSERQRGGAPMDKKIPSKGHSEQSEEFSCFDKEIQSPADAMITKVNNLPLAIFSADCLSLFFYDPKNKAIGLGHAGWRGSCLEIAKKIVIAMEERFSTSSDELIVGFGPSIRSCCYQVGEEFIHYFPKDIIRQPDGLYLDLIKINKKQLYSCGIRQKNILDSGLCTSCLNREFFSYRKEGSSSGRMLSLMMLK